MENVTEYVKCKATDKAENIFIFSDIPGYFFIFMKSECQRMNENIQQNY